MAGRMEAHEPDIRRVIARGFENPAADGEVTDLARRILAWQAAACPPIANLCRARGVVLEAIRDWREIPAVPVRAFREMAVRAFPEGEAVRVFRTSGTTARTRGEHAFRAADLEVYRAAIERSVRHYVVPDRERIACVVLHPSPEEVPDSSLGFMFGDVLSRFGTGASGTYVRGGTLLAEEAALRLRDAAAAGEPVLVLATAFALADLLDVVARPVALPEGSRILETGGFKGRRREVAKDELHLACFERLGVSSPWVVSEYGMTELTSQAHDRTLRAWVMDEEVGKRMKVFPPWVRVTAHDPETLGELPDGEVGLLAILDLANVGAAVRVQTEDLGYTDRGAFDVIGRAEGAELRGCSLLIEELRL